MSELSFWDWIKYGPSAPAVAKKRQREAQAVDTLRTLAELQAVSAMEPTAAKPVQEPRAVPTAAEQPGIQNLLEKLSTSRDLPPGGTPADVSRWQINYPEITYGPEERLQEFLALRDLGEKGDALSNSRMAQVRASLLEQAAPDLSPAQQANTANKLDVSPTRVSGGVAFNRFDGPAQNFGITPVGESTVAANRARARRSDAAANLDNFRTDELTALIAQISEPALRANIINKLDASGARVSDGVVYDRFGGADQPVGVTPVGDSRIGLADERSETERRQQAAIEAQVRQRTAGADEREFRLNVLQEALAAIDDPLLRADIANSKKAFNTQRVTVHKPDGSKTYVDAYLQPNGRYDYADAEMDGAPLTVPPSAAGPIQKDADYLETALGLSKRAAARLALSIRTTLKTKSPEDAWAELVDSVRTEAFGRHGRNPGDMYERAATVWQVMFPETPIPADAALRSNLGIEPGAASAVQADAADSASQSAFSPDRAESEARRRAENEGYTNTGAWVQGRGLEVFDEQGKLIGYYY